MKRLRLNLSQTGCWYEAEGGTAIDCTYKQMLAFHRYLGRRKSGSVQSRTPDILLRYNQITITPSILADLCTSNESLVIAKTLELSVRENREPTPLLVYVARMFSGDMKLRRRTKHHSRQIFL